MRKTVPPPAQTVARPGLGPLLDLTAVALLLGAGLWLWPHGTVGPQAPPEGAPVWATLQDYLLDGLDAGEWGDQTSAYFSGRYESLDGHRMPTWTIVAGLFAGMGVPLAGHFANHLLQLFLPVVVYALARVTSVGPGLALGAGLTVATNAVLVVSSRRFGVDPTIYFMLPAAMLGAHLVAFRWWMSPLSGAIAAAAAVSHFTTLPFAVPAALATLLWARPVERGRAAFGFATGFALCLYLIFRVFPWIGLKGLVNSVGESAALKAPGAVKEVPWGDIFQKALDNAFETVPAGLLDYTSRLNLPMVPASILLGLVLLGAVGWALPTQPLEPVSRRARRLSPPSPLQGWYREHGPAITQGAPMLLALAPVPVLLLMSAPMRYAETLTPLATVLAFRGVASLIYVGTSVWNARVRRLPSGLLDGALGLVCVGSMAGTVSQGISSQVMTDQLAEREMGLSLAQHFPAGTCVASPVREPPAYAGLTYARSMCPTSANEEAYRACLGSIRRGCPGELPLAWMVVSGLSYDSRSPARQGMDDWIAQQYPLVAEFQAGRVHVKIASVNPNH